MAPAHAGGAITARRVVGGLNSPVAFTIGPGGGIWYVEKTTGEIRIHSRTGRDHLFFDVRGVSGTGERGMLGIALHPNYPAKPFVFVYVTRSAGGTVNNQIVRLRNEGGRGTHFKVILSTLAGGPYHNGGRIQFGPDGRLYAIVGDAHDSANSQQLGDRRGKILRLTPKGGVPADNPVIDGRRNRVYAYGIRNSFGFDFAPATGDLWETENGPSCNDELNRIIPGGNHGWGPNQDCSSGSAPDNTNNSGPLPRHGPKHYFANPIGITGMAFCDGCGLGAGVEGTFLFGAVNNSDIRRATLDAAGTDITSVNIFYTHSQSTLSFETGPGGTIFFSDFGGIYRLVQA